MAVGTREGVPGTTVGDAVVGWGVVGGVGVEGGLHGPFWGHALEPGQGDAGVVPMFVHAYILPVVAPVFVQ